jgi:transposase
MSIVPAAIASVITSGVGAAVGGIEAAADGLHRSRPWASYWLDSFSKEGIDGLKDRSKSGRPAEIPTKWLLE